MSSSNVAVTYPNAAALVITKLRAALPSLLFCHDVPTARPDIFVRVFRTGGPRDSVIDQAQLTIESWAPDSDTAETNAQTVRDVLNGLPGQILGGYPVYRVDELSGPGDLPDPLSDSRRSTWSVQVWIRGY